MEKYLSRLLWDSIFHSTFQMKPRRLNDQKQWDEHLRGMISTINTYHDPSWHHLKTRKKAQRCLVSQSSSFPTTTYILELCNSAWGNPACTNAISRSNSHAIYPQNHQLSNRPDHRSDPVNSLIILIRINFNIISNRPYHRPSIWKLNLAIDFNIILAL